MYGGEREGEEGGRGQVMFTKHKQHARQACSAMSMVGLLSSAQQIGLFACLGVRGHLHLRPFTRSTIDSFPLKDTVLILHSCTTTLPVPLETEKLTRRVELQAVMGSLRLVLETKPKSSARAISTAPKKCFSEKCVGLSPTPRPMKFISVEIDQIFSK